MLLILRCKMSVTVSHGGVPEHTTGHSHLLPCPQITFEPFIMNNDRISLQLQRRCSNRPALVCDLCEREPRVMRRITWRGAKRPARDRYRSMLHVIRV